MPGSGAKMDKGQLAVQNQLNLKSVNHCIPGILSKCGAGTTWTEQRLCSFAVKSDFANKCMYYNQSMDGHCDCIDAQKDAVEIFKDLDV
jgi:hypothetical protein